MSEQGCVTKKELLIFLIILAVVLIFSCAEKEEIIISEDCYKLDHLDTYLADIPKYNTTIWYITHEGEEVKIGCSWADAYVYKWQYNCDNYPNTFGEIANVFISRQTPCE